MAYRAPQVAKKLDQKDVAARAFVQSEFRGPRSSGDGEKPGHICQHFLQHDGSVSAELAQHLVVGAREAELMADVVPAQPEQ